LATPPKPIFSLGLHRFRVCLLTHDYNPYYNLVRRV